MKTGKAWKLRMDGGEYISSMENMDPTLAELGDEFTLGDIDGEILVLGHIFIVAIH